MNATELLMAEHRVIEQVLDALEAYASRIERGEGVDVAEVARFAEFFRGFADACHHGKEEDVLFAEMEDAGFPRDSGPLGTMRNEHAAGRRYVGKIRELAQRKADWAVEDREAFAGVAHAYARLLRQHIRKEDEVLFPMAESHLGPDAWRRVTDLFGVFERQRRGSGEHARLHRLAEQLLARHIGVPAARAHAREHSARV